MQSADGSAVSALVRAGAASLLLRLPESLSSPLAPLAASGEGDEAASDDRIVQAAAAGVAASLGPQARRGARARVASPAGEISSVPFPRCRGVLADGQQIESLRGCVTRRRAPIQVLAAVEELLLAGAWASGWVGPAAADLLRLGPSGATGAPLTRLARGPWRRSRTHAAVPACFCVPAPCTRPSRAGASRERTLA